MKVIFQPIKKNGGLVKSVIANMQIYLLFYFTTLVEYSFLFVCKLAQHEQAGKLLV